ncbi:hypothetical protein L1887_24065 [Cichorium endivia]|nr:hypothetical protein L1887_24065 [Cichorium endivia]
MASKCFFFLQLLLFVSNSVTSSDIPHAQDSNDHFERRELDREKEQLLPSIHRTLIEYFRYKLTEFDSIDPPTTALPSPPITNPVTAPPVTNPVNTAPGIVTVPGANPVGVSPNPTTTNPMTNPVTPPVPVTNPVTTPSTNPGGQPTVNPVTPPSVMPPPTTSGGNGNGNGNAPAGRGQSWCVAKNGASQAALQSALDYACGIGGADCATIQQGSSCYEPATLQNHASYAFNSYYQKNPVPTSCDFGGAATVTTTNPSIGSCIFPSSSSSSSSSSPSTPTTPTMQAPVNPTSLPTPTSSSLPTPTSSSGSTIPGTQSPPPGFSFGNPDPGSTGLGAFGASPPLGNTASASNGLRPFVFVSFIMMFCV